MLIPAGDYHHCKTKHTNEREMMLRNLNLFRMFGSIAMTEFYDISSIGQNSTWRMC